MDRDLPKRSYYVVRLRSSGLFFVLRNPYGGGRGFMTSKAQDACLYSYRGEGEYPIPPGFLDKDAWEPVGVDVVVTEKEN